MRSESLKRHHGFVVQFECSVETADEIAVFRENARRAEKSDVVVFSEIALDAKNAENRVFIN